MSPKTNRGPQGRDTSGEISAVLGSVKEIILSGGKPGFWPDGDCPLQGQCPKVARSRKSSRRCWAVAAVLACGLMAALIGTGDLVASRCQPDTVTYIDGARIEHYRDLGIKTGAGSSSQPGEVLVAMMSDSLKFVEAFCWEQGKDRACFLVEHPGGNLPDVCEVVEMEGVGLVPFLMAAADSLRKVVKNDGRPLGDCEIRINGEPHPASAWEMDTGRWGTVVYRESRNAHPPSGSK